MSRPRFTALVDGLPALVPFVGPEAQERARGRAFRARLGANESLFGPSPKALAAMRAAADGNWMYADPESHELRAALAQFHGVGLDNIVIGEGIDGLLGLAVKLVVEPGSAVVTSDGTYPTFNFHVAGGGGRLVRVPYRDDKQDLGALLDAARREDARILYVCNPDNPMGSFWAAEALRGLIAALPSGVLLLLDEAYCDTAPAAELLPVDAGNAQVLRLRTFSKAYGLAGARIGYCIGEARVIRAFEKVRNHYGINRVGQIGALARSRIRNTSRKRWVALSARATSSVPSRARTTSPRCPRRPTSSPSIADATATLPSACSTGLWRTMCSPACRASRRSTAASA